MRYFPVWSGAGVQETLTAAKSADPRAGTDREDLRWGLHRSQNTPSLQAKPRERVLYAAAEG